MTLLDKMLDALTTAYNRKPDGNIGKLFSIYAEQLDAASNQLMLIEAQRSLDEAGGATLDLLGANFGIAREGVNDKLYRLLIKVKNAALLSGGDIDTVLTSVAALYELDIAQVGLKELYPAKIQVRLPSSVLAGFEDQLSHERVLALVKRIIPAGIGLIIVLWTESVVPLYCEVITVSYSRAAGWIEN